MPCWTVTPNPLSSTLTLLTSELHVCSRIEGNERLRLSSIAIEFMRLLISAL
ncbi:unnamed protein product [Haemonchus placei]|uniref:Uncharacterized protein n=1 Tax=Haemonchus placei TaxID=6290 RepID=A0A0N4W4Y4_HAEPC|nr:unnamed protein product [Haemonchus placei]